MSDGELDEGSNWEAFLSASHGKLNNLVAIVDRNKLQSIEDTETTLIWNPYLEKLNLLIGRLSPLMVIITQN